MIKKIRKTLRGFTLIELLVVIAIIGLLASIVLVSLSTARKKARDSRRVGDLRQVQLALELYADDNSGSYPGPGTLCAATPCTNAEGSALFTGVMGTGLVTKYLGGLPTDPTNEAPATGGKQYKYVPGNTTSGPTTGQCTAALSCSHYILSVTTEQTETELPALKNDVDGASGGWTAQGFACGTAGTDSIYCVAS